MDEPAEENLFAPRGFRERWSKRSFRCEDISVQPEEGAIPDVPVQSSGAGPAESGPPIKFAPQSLVNLQWKREAELAKIKRARVDLPKLPWEQPPFDQLLGSSHSSLDNFLGSQSKMFLPTTIGLDETVDGILPCDEPESPPPFSLASSLRPPGIQRARKQKPDDDVRRVALQRLRAFLMSDPAATSLGASVQNMLEDGANQELIEQSISDAFRGKASSTLQKRAGSLTRFFSRMQSRDLNPLRFSEEELYWCMCMMRDGNTGPTSAQHLLESIHFFHGVAHFNFVDMAEVISSRCRGAARDQFLNKRPLEQKWPLSAKLVRRMELMMQTLHPIEAAILGQLLFCVHSCARWSDSLRITKLWSEETGGEILVHADALGSKTSTTAESQRRLIPYVALGMGVSGTPWSKVWFEARSQTGLDNGSFFLASFSEKTGQWVEAPMSSSEATFWLRHFIDRCEPGEELTKYGTHSCKPTLLTWVGRCSSVFFSQAERRLLGHHLTPNAKSVATYSRESYTSIYGRVLKLYRKIRSFEYDPDRSALHRILDAADVDSEPLPKDSVPDMAEENHSVVLVGSDSSIASECDFPIHDFGDESAPAEEGHGLSDFSSDALMVHRISKVLHVINEDDTFACGRCSSRNYELLADLQVSPHLFEPCNQCLNAVRARDTNL